MPPLGIRKAAAQVWIDSHAVAGIASRPTVHATDGRECVKKPMIFALRGAVGFGLGILLTSGAFWLYSSSGERGSLAYSLSNLGTHPVVGGWRYFAEHGHIQDAKFSKDGTFWIRYTKGDYRQSVQKPSEKKGVTGTYSRTDASTVQLQPPTPYVSARLDKKDKRLLEVVREDGMVEPLACDDTQGPSNGRSLVFLINAIGWFCMTGAVGALVLLYGTAHWKRATVGFGVSFVPISLAMLFLPLVIWGFGESHTNEFGAGPVAVWLIGHALYGGIGGCCKCRELALPGAVAFGLPELFFFVAALLAANLEIMGFAVIFALPIGGALFGFVVGRLEERTRLAPLPKD